MGLCGTGNPTRLARRLRIIAIEPLGAFTGVSSFQTPPPCFCCGICNEASKNAQNTPGLWYIPRFCSARRASLRGFTADLRRFTADLRRFTAYLRRFAANLRELTAEPREFTAKRNILVLFEKF